MKTLSLLSVLAASAAAFVLYTSTSHTAEAEAPAPEIQATAPLTVAELFTSQSCSSCPPAEKLFSTLADRDDLLTLEWHVDYWDTLVHGGSKWKDRYSSQAFTNRQRAYNQSLRGTRGVYTPQAIVNGYSEDVGNRRSAVSGIIDDANALPLTVQIENNAVNVGGTKAGVEVLFVRLLKQHETDVKGGENKGRKLSGKNIVLEAKVLGETEIRPTQFKIPVVEEGETCAVIVQPIGGRAIGPILGAAKCG